MHAELSGADRRRGLVSGSARCLLAGIALARIAAADIPLEDFARHDRYRDVKISPDGDYLAASSIVDGKAVLSLIHLSDMKGVNVVPRDNDDLAHFWWVGRRRVMYTIGHKVGGLEAPIPTGELFTVDADGGDGKTIFGRTAGTQASTLIAHATSELAFGELIAPLHDDSGAALIASYPVNGPTLGPYRSASSLGVFPEAFRIDLRTGVKTRVATSPLRNAKFMADAHGSVRIAYGVDVDHQLKVYYRATDGADWELVFDRNKQGVSFEPEAFGRDGKQIYLLCDGVNGVGGVCRWDAQTRKVETLWSGTESGPTILMLKADESDAFAVESMTGRPAVSLLDKDASESKLLKSLMQQFPGQRVRLGAQTRDGSKRIIGVDSDKDPGQFYLLDMNSKKLSFLLARRPWIKPEQMAQEEPVSVKSRDGLMLYGYLTRPPGKEDAKNLPLVVYVHGGPYGVRDGWGFESDTQMLASRGYAVLQVNFRGSGGFGDKFVQSGFREWGGKMQDDITDATRAMIAQGIADLNRICIFGGSYGGYAALEGAVKEPDLYKCTIGYVGIYDLGLMYSRGDIPQSLYGENYLKMVLGENQDELFDRSPIAHLDKLKAKVMLIVGGADQRVPAIQGERLHQALEARKIAHEWIYERTEGHGFYDEKHVTDMYAKIIAFLDREIGTPR